MKTYNCFQPFNCFWMVIFIMLCIQGNPFAQTTNNFQVPTSINEDGAAPVGSAILDVKSTTKGLLIPRMTQAQRDAIASPATGLLIYQTNASPGFFYYNSTSWVPVNTLDVSVIVDADDDTKIQVEKGTDEDIIRMDIKGSERLVLKQNANGSTLVELPNNANNVFIGDGAGADNAPNVGSDEGTSNVFMGWLAGNKNTTGSWNTIIGNGTGINNTTGAGNTFLGESAGANNLTGSDNIFLGRFSGLNATGSSNVFLGFESGLNETGDNKLYIDNSSTASPLIWGDFNSNLLRVNGTFNINNAFSFPTSDGTNGQVLQTNGSGVLAWTTPSGGGSGDNLGNHTATQALGMGSFAINNVLDPTAAQDAATKNYVDTQVSGVMLDEIKDADNNTKIQVEESANENIIRMDLDGSERLVIQKNAGGETQLLLPNNDGNIFLGENSGTANTTAQFNTFIGGASGFKTTTGGENTFIGEGTGVENLTGAQNTFLGRFAGQNILGSGNVMLGYSAGKNETASNKLYIDNSDTASPLVFGDFNTDLLRVNGTLNVNNAFSFPTTDGTNGQVLQTNGSGVLAWASSSGDNLGNHTATQALNMGNMAINNVLDPVNAQDAATKNYVDTQVAGVSQDEIKDADNNTKIQVEESANENIIRMDLDGSERLVIRKNAKGNTMLETPDNDSNVFLGENAGATNDATGASPQGESNVFVGWQAGAANTTGAFNMFLGGAAGFKNTTANSNIFIGDGTGFNNVGGADNTYIGRRAGFNSTGSGNVFLGKDVGSNETGSNRLYIDNSDTASPLVFGDFNSDLLRVNGTLNVNNAFSFPTSDDSNGQVLQTNGSGAITWTTPSAGATDEIKDADGNTKIQVEESANENIIRMDLDGSERLVLKKNTIGLTMLELPNNEFNVFLGSEAGNSTVSSFPKYNVSIGFAAGKNATTGDRSVFVGASAGKDVTTGRWNTFVGTNAGISATTGIGNVIIGSEAGTTVTSGHYNTFLGFQTGSSASGSGNVFLGRDAGFSETGSNLLYIENSNSSTPLIWGDFSANRVGIDRVATTNTFEVSGNASKAAAGDWLANSDARLKKAIQPLNSEATLQQLLQLQGITYEWNDDQTGYHRPEGAQYGFTAQNIQEVFPTLVQEDADGWLQTAYGTYDAMYVEAFRAVVQRMEKLERENRELKAQLQQVQELKAAVAELKGMLLQTANSAGE